MLLIALLCCLFIIHPTFEREADNGTSAYYYCAIKEQCFHLSAEECPDRSSICRCRQLPNCKNTAICCNVNELQLTEGLNCGNISGNNIIEALHIRNATLDKFNVSKLRTLKLLRYITVTDGKINSVVGEFSRHTGASCLNFSSNGIMKFDNRSLVNLYNLNFLDLSQNNLTDVPRFKKEGNVTLDISGNKHMLCTNLLNALHSELHFSNGNNSFCSSARSFHWFNTTEFVPLSQIIGIHELRQNCYKNCTCEPERLEILPDKMPTYSVSVDCSGQNLTYLPSPLPPNTVSLNISSNFITSIELVSTDSSYQHLRQLYADNNQIVSILPLEGSMFLSNFVAFTLKNNKIRSLPTYIFSNVFDRNNFRSLHLGSNKLQCDCNTAKVLKVWLLTKQKNIPDYNEIFCDNMNLKVMDLNPSKLCQSQQHWIDYIYYIITIEVLLLVGLVTKVIYDYCIFKTSGYLPWPASKMPKLPCDCLCE